MKKIQFDIHPELTATCATCTNRHKSGIDRDFRLPTVWKRPRDRGEPICHPSKVPTTEKEDLGRPEDSGRSGKVLFTLPLEK